MIENTKSGFLAINIAFILTLSGCAATKFNADIDSQEVSFPEINKTNTQNLGTALVVQSKKYTFDAWEISEPFTVGIINVKIGPGVLLKVGQDAEYYYFRHESANANIDSVRVKIGTSEICYIGVNNVLYCGLIPQNQKLSLIKHTVNHKNSFQQDLIYTGKFGKKIRLAYREFSNDMARPAFTTDIEYDMSESNVIGYKDALIEVIDATNQKITYKLLKNFSAPK